MMSRPNPAHARNPAAPQFLPPRHKLNPRSREDVDGIVKKIRDRKPRGYAVTPDDVVAALPFGFWEVLITGLAHTSQPTGLQANILALVFPNAPDIATVPCGHVDFKQRVVNLLSRIRDLRNRIGHHDALWSTPEFDRYGRLGFVPRRPRHSVNSFRLFADNVCWFVGWIDPAISAYVKGSDHWWSLQALLQRRALVIYRLSGGAVGTYRSILDTTELPRGGREILISPKLKHKERLIAHRYFY